MFDGQVKHVDSIEQVAQDIWQDWQINAESK